MRLLFKKQQGRGSRELQAGQLHFSFWEVYGADPPGNLLFQTHEGKESDWEQPAWIYWSQTMPDQPECLLQWNIWLCGQGEWMSLTWASARLLTIFSTASLDPCAQLGGTHGRDGSRQVTVSSNWKLWGHSASLVFSCRTPEYKSDIVIPKQGQQRVTETVKRLCTWHSGAWDCPWSIGIKKSPLNSLPIG